MKAEQNNNNINTINNKINSVINNLLILFKIDNQIIVQVQHNIKSHIQRTLKL